MTDTKKPTLSEIRVRERAASKGLYETTICDGSGEIIKQTDISYLLDLVSRMGRALGRLVPVVEAVAGDRKTKEAAAEARALIEEIKL